MHDGISGWWSSSSWWADGRTDGWCAAMHFRMGWRNSLFSASDVVVAVLLLHRIELQSMSFCPLSVCLSVWCTQERIQYSGLRCVEIVVAYRGALHCIGGGRRGSATKTNQRTHTEHWRIQISSLPQHWLAGRLFVIAERNKMIDCSNLL